MFLSLLWISFPSSSMFLNIFDFPQSNVRNTSTPAGGQNCDLELCYHQPRILRSINCRIWRDWPAYPQSSGYKLHNSISFTRSGSIPRDKPGTLDRLQISSESEIPSQTTILFHQTFITSIIIFISNCPSWRKPESLLPFSSPLTMLATKDGRFDLRSGAFECAIEVSSRGSLGIDFEK